ncbi:BACON domain-containing protein [Alistipes communis]|uniref:BACON domain-containing protein n=1 Tax=Alistipes communis TaxID=2585118 RepID=UPI0018984037|nr:BACON domain-containing carbohydrate-binding protein [Alistipes communis]
MKKLLTMFAIVCAFLASCDSEGGDLNRTPLLKVVGPDGSDPSQPISIDGKSQEVAFTILATADWTADIAGDEGFALSDRSGATGNTKVTVVAARNLSGATRSATVSFRLGGEERYAYTISQTEEQPYLDVDPAAISIVGDRTEFTVAVSTNQSPWKVEIDSPDGDGWLTQQSKESASITFLAEENTTGKNRTATLKFVSELHPEVFNYVTVTQGYVVPAPTADLLDVVFAEDGTAKDVSAMGMTVELRRNEFVSTSFLEKYGRFAAVFTHEPALTKRDAGYYVIEYNDNPAFKSKLEDGYAMELLFCRHDDPINKQIKPFAASQGGGASICFWADAANQIVMETGTNNAGKNAWKTAKSGITPLKDVYYHVVAVWDKAAGTQRLYIDGELKASNNFAVADFYHMVVTKDSTGKEKRWFGIGADPGPNDQGEITFKGEVVIARIYDDPINADQVHALWKLVK